jgi:dynein heavy chain
MAGQASNYVTSWVADAFQCDSGLVSAACDQASPAVKELWSAFTKTEPPSNTNALFFFYQDGKVVLTDGSEMSLKGKCVYAVRGNYPLKVPSEDITCGFMENDVLGEMDQVLGSAFTPVLQGKDDWGAINKETSSSIRVFMDSMGKYGDTVKNLGDVSKQFEELAIPEQFASFNIQDDPKSIKDAAAKPDVIECFEQTLYDWCRQIELILAASEQVRSESDDVGPSAELEHWKSRMAKFNSISDQLNDGACKIILDVIKHHNPRALRPFKDLSDRINDSAVEASDNVKYLYSLEKNSAVLYQNDPKLVIDAIPGLISAIGLMYNIARHYNTSERLTALFVKITNEMITCCKNYIRVDKEDTSCQRIWDQDRKHMIAKMGDCVQLNAVYQQHYTETARQLEGSGAPKQFDFSKMAIFGKFDQFCKRLEKLINMFSTVDQFSSLKLSTIQGMSPISQTFAGIEKKARSKAYDLLDHRGAEFDKDYTEFKAEIAKLETDLRKFIDSQFERMTNTDRALSLLRQFQFVIHRQSLMDLLETKYILVFDLFAADIESTKRMYEKYKDKPPLMRDCPPVAGKIAWSRQLLNRVESPMKIFQLHHPATLHRPEAKPVIKSYNKLASALIQFETLWHDGWKSYVDQAKAGLAATLLVEHPETGEIYVNFDHTLSQLIQETKGFQRLNMDVPATALFLLKQEAKYKSFYDNLAEMLAMYRSVMDRIPGEEDGTIHDMFNPAVNRIRKLLEPGLKTFTWTSANIDDYLSAVTQSLVNLDAIIHKCTDLLAFRVHKNIEAMSTIVLVQIPEDQSFTPAEFKAFATAQVEEKAPMLDSKTYEIELACKDFLGLIDETAPPEDAASLEVMKKRFVHENKTASLQALIAGIRNSLRELRDRFSPQMSGALLGFMLETPIFKVDVKLSIPEIKLEPSLDEIREAINFSAKAILKSAKKVFAWDQDRDAPADRLKNHFVNVGKDPQIVKVVLQLTGTFAGLRKKVDDHLQMFHGYDWLWQNSKSEDYKAFMATEPTTEDYVKKIKYYTSVGDDLHHLLPIHVIDSISLDSSQLKQSLLDECLTRDDPNNLSWKFMYGMDMKKSASNELNTLFTFIEDTKTKLGKEVSTLDDVREQMEVLGELREQAATFHAQFGPVKDTYDLLAKFDIPVGIEDMDKKESCDTQWVAVAGGQGIASEQITRLNEAAPNYKTSLLEGVAAFNDEEKSFQEQWAASGPNVDGISPKEATERLTIFQKIFDEKEKKMNANQRGEELFGLPVTEYPQMTQVKKDLSMLNKLYSLYNEVINTIDGYVEILWTEIDFKAIRDEIEKFQNRCKKLPKDLKEWPAFKELDKKIIDFGDIMPMLEDLKHPAIQERHWKKLAELTAKADLATLYTEIDVFKMKDITDANLLKVRDEVDEMTAAAVKELDVEKKLKAIVEFWTPQCLEFEGFKGKGNLLLSAGRTTELITKLEEDQMVLGSLMSNRFNGPFKTQIQTWVTYLTRSSEEIEYWLMVQTSWRFLEGVFSGGDIAKSLPAEAKRFSATDKSWTKVMQSCEENPNMVRCCYTDELVHVTLPHIWEQLEVIQKSLAAFLDVKRQIFPRFYYVSDGVLLEILGQASDPHTIQSNLQNIFDSVAYVDFDAIKRNNIKAINSGVPKEGSVGKTVEKVSLSDIVAADGNVEDWLGTLEKVMQRTLRDICRDCNNYVGTLPCKEFLEKFPAQIGLAGLMILWTLDMEEGLSNARYDKNVMKVTAKKIKALLDELIEITLMELTPIFRRNVETCITIQVHQVTIANDLVKAKVRSAADFDWQKQTRVYWRTEVDSLYISVTDVDFEYCYEYLGCTERLVITELTDRCYITLAQALGLNYGGAPAGPAGTGKTETTKDMGRTLGKYVVVFNCSDQMEPSLLAKLFKGLSQGGQWGCFDEFNRIELPVLSVVAEQVKCVLDARKAHAKKFIFMGETECVLNRGTGFFITMNPGYAGRQELPENVKIQFRSVSMMVPNRETIMMVKLAAAGIKDNIVLAKKFFILYGLCEQQLSKQRHYDFGLRNILSVLRTLGPTKRKLIDDPEHNVFQMVVRDLNLSKLVDEDDPLFRSLIDDLFPGLNVPPAQYPDLQAAMEKWIVEDKLVNDPGWNLKVVQLYECAKVRWGIMLLGPSKAGKSQAAKILTDCAGDIPLFPADAPAPNKHLRPKMNPKAILAPQMFGLTDPGSGEWIDGIFNVLWKRGTTPPNNEFTWIMLDGPVDAVWIENLNTVLTTTRPLPLHPVTACRCSARICRACSRCTTWTTRPLPR